MSSKPEELVNQELILNIPGVEFLKLKKHSILPQSEDLATKFGLKD